eukprot:CAMPEP_0183511576 /NCGR_PEP_ID=MMETSP0371-20130417/10990_1 /TAXON_ID=268820 /ORGANISM="Peridinium aciculiferum, Strain PAER-2" /LENGTH=57 /DNA_ID=CAMNT_0025708515 /DNA_START=1 /DNA_END=174 /DNA_ORIENTATION=+
MGMGDLIGDASLVLISVGPQCQAFRAACRVQETLSAKRRWFSSPWARRVQRLGPYAA